MLIQKGGTFKQIEIKRPLLKRYLRKYAQFIIIYKLSNMYNNIYVV